MTIARFTHGLLLLLLGITGLQGQALFISNINYIDVNKGAAQKGSILVEDGSIKAIGKDLQTPTGVKIIDGKNKWLIPGLIDANVHMSQSGSLYCRPDGLDFSDFRSLEEEQKWTNQHIKEFLKRYLKLGITTIVDGDMAAAQLYLRDSYQDSTAYPNWWTSGPVISNYSPEVLQEGDQFILKVTSEEEAQSTMDQLQNISLDFIKVWFAEVNRDSPQAYYPVFKTIIDAAHKRGLKVAFHTISKKATKVAIFAGADIIINSVEEAIDEELLRMIQTNGVFYVPALQAKQNFVNVLKQEPAPGAADFEFANPMALGTMYDYAHLPKGNNFELYELMADNFSARRAIQDSIQLDNLNKINESTQLIATGTEAGSVGTMHASSYHREIEKMQAVGLSNAEILKYSTINGARMLGKEDRFGSIDTGKMADMVILRANPLKDINAIKDIEYVVKAGKLHQPDALLSPTPEQLAQQQLNGYNGKNIDAFLAPYSDKVELYTFPDELFAKGKGKMRAIYEPMFAQNPDLHCKLVDRMVLGNTIIDQEQVTGIKGRDLLEAVAVYKIEDGKIAKVYFLNKE